LARQTDLKGDSEGRSNRSLNHKDAHEHFPDVTDVSSWVELGVTNVSSGIIEKRDGPLQCWIDYLEL
jgi:hypothetical protein